MEKSFLNFPRMIDVPKCSAMTMKGLTSCIFLCRCQIHVLMAKFSPLNSCDDNARNRDRTKRKTALSVFWHLCMLEQGFCCTKKYKKYKYKKETQGIFHVGVDLTRWWTRLLSYKKMFNEFAWLFERQTNGNICVVMMKFQVSCALHS